MPPRSTGPVATRITPRALHDAAPVIRCLGHPLRLRLLEEMERGEKTVTELRVAVGAGQAIVSQQLAILRGRGVIDARRSGAFVHYRITDPRVHQILDCMRDDPAE